MPRTNRNLTEKITIQITRPMLADLQNVATKSGKPLAEIIRQAIRNALDDTDLTLGTKRRFDRRLQKRIDEMEQNLKQSLELGLGQAEEQLAQGLQEELDKLEYRVLLNTANGTIRAARVTVTSLKIGGATLRNLGILVSGSTASDVSVLGIGTLNRFRGYQVRDGILTLFW